MRITTLAAICALAASQAACMGGLPGAGPKFDFDKFVNNPACDHTDKVAGVTGAAGIPASLQFEASRVCHAAPAPLVVGSVIAPVAGTVSTGP